MSGEHVRLFNARYCVAVDSVCVCVCYEAMEIMKQCISTLPVLKKIVFPPLPLPIKSLHQHIYKMFSKNYILY